jgi:hypothetical protein
MLWTSEQPGYKKKSGRNYTDEHAPTFPHLFENSRFFVSIILIKYKEISGCSCQPTDKK